MVRGSTMGGATQDGAAGVAGGDDKAADSGEEEEEEQDNDSGTDEDGGAPLDDPMMVSTVSFEETKAEKGLTNGIAGTIFCPDPGGGPGRHWANVRGSVV